MIQLAIFDLDGFLVNTEQLKAGSYARAVAALCPGKVAEAEVLAAYKEMRAKAASENSFICSISETEVVEAYKDLVGRSRQEMAEGLVKRFSLEDSLRPYMEKYSISEPWQALVKVRMPLYEAMISDSETIRSNQWAHNVSLVHFMRKAGYRTALATMSDKEHVQRILGIIALERSFDLVVSGEDVHQGKPDPEIYLRMSKELGIQQSDCLVFEDSLTGVKGGLAAGMWVIAVTTPFTERGVHEAGILEDKWIVDDPSRLQEVVGNMLKERQEDE